jgi:hypothetical protein
MILVVIVEDLHPPMSDEGFLAPMIDKGRHIGGHPPWTITADHHEEEVITTNLEVPLGATFEDHLVVEEVDHHHDAHESIRLTSFSIPGKKSGLGLRIAAASV